MSNTAKQLVNKIVECTDELCAVDIIKEVISNLKVSRNYQRMVEVEGGIRELEKAFSELQEEFHKNGVTKTIQPCSRGKNKS